MGATTIWERWDSMLPDGSINPGDMTSFNHYAFGAVADWLHRTVAGLAPAAPGYRRLRIAPRPGPGITSAAATHETPYGTAAVAWTLTTGRRSPSRSPCRRTRPRRCRCPTAARRSRSAPAGTRSRAPSPSRSRSRSRNVLGRPRNEHAQRSAGSSAIRVAEPVIPGFNPDPSVVRVDGVYYLVTSTFEYVPGMPVYRSTDLVEWEQIGNVVTRPEQVGSGEVPTPGGVWAPTIRHRDGVFYVIVTVMLAPRGCVVFTATDPAGPWSDGVTDARGARASTPTSPGTTTAPRTSPTPVRREPGIVQGGRPGDRRCARGAPTAGTGTAAIPEGPHLYRLGGYWYLLVAEGGTERGHAVSIARGTSPTGPFESSPTIRC